MKEAIKQYGAIIENVQKDIDEAESFKADLMEEYKALNSLDDMIKIQSMVLKTTDYISQKRISKVELERQKREYEEAYAKMQNECEAEYVQD